MGLHGSTGFLSTRSGVVISSGAGPRVAGPEDGPGASWGVGADGGGPEDSSERSCSESELTETGSVVDDGPDSDVLALLGRGREATGPGGAPGIVVDERVTYLRVGTSDRGPDERRGGEASETSREDEVREEPPRVRAMSDKKSSFGNGEEETTVLECGMASGSF